MFDTSCLCHPQVRCLWKLGIPWYSMVYHIQESPSFWDVRAPSSRPGLLLQHLESDLGHAALASGTHSRGARETDQWSLVTSMATPFWEAASGCVSWGIAWNNPWLMATWLRKMMTIHESLGYPIFRSPSYPMLAVTHCGNQGIPINQYTEITLRVLNTANTARA